MQDLAMSLLTAGARGDDVDPEPLIRAARNTLDSNALDPAFKAEAILLPQEALIAERIDVVDSDAIHRSREQLRHALGSSLSAELKRAQASTATGTDQTPLAKGTRRLRSVALDLIAGGDPAEGLQLAKAQFDAADNMTDRQRSLAVLASLDGPEREEALAAFLERFKDDALVVDNGSRSSRPRNAPIRRKRVEQLATHALFSLTNPNRLRAVVSQFAMNQWAFNEASGRGYRFVADMIMAADRLNPQIAARLVPAFGKWRRFEPTRSALMREQLERIVGTSGLSRDTYEQASKSLS